jgi:hypothetical protein
MGIIKSFKKFFNKEEPKIKKDFNIEEFNNWFINDYEGYGGKGGAKGIYLRLDKLSPSMINDYLLEIGYSKEDVYKNSNRCLNEIRKDWNSKR